jgi:hypothetical protein
MTTVRFALAGCAFAFALLFGETAGAQEAPAPVGYWLTQPPSESLLVDASGLCKFAAVNSLPVQGSCSWKPSSRGGILTIIGHNTYLPAPVYFNVVWVNARTIRVWGDVFYKKR